MIFIPVSTGDIEVMTQEEFEKEWLDSCDTVACHTSGSTGTPKEIRLPKAFMRESARRTNSFFGITETSRLHTCLDFCYIASKMMLVRAEEAKCRLTSEFPSSMPLKDIEKDEAIDLLSVVPAQMGWLLDEHTGRSGIRHILVGGSAIPPILRRRIALSEYDVWETYGMTETASHVALRKVTDDDRTPFVALPGITVGINEGGCLVIDMPGMDPIVTNDLAEAVSETEFRILGRADNCIISGGVKIIPEELESLLGPFIAFDYYVSSVPDEKWSERLVLAVDPAGCSLDRDFLKKAILLRLGQYKTVLSLGPKSPKEVIFVDSFPRTPNGKIDRVALKKKLKEEIG